MGAHQTLSGSDIQHLICSLSYEVLGNELHQLSLMLLSLVNGDIHMQWHRDMLVLAFCLISFKMACLHLSLLYTSCPRIEAIFLFQLLK